MIALVYGALGTILVLALLGLGAFLGWYCAVHIRKKTSEEATEEERRHLAAEQRAFECMLGYNPDTAYGEYGDPERLGGGEL